MSEGKSLSSPKGANFPKGKRTLDLAVYLSIFGIGLLFLLIHFYLWVIPRWNTARNIESHPCIVLETRIGTREHLLAAEEPPSNAGDKETSAPEAILEYRPEIHIEYRFGERTYAIWTYEPATLGDGGYFPDRKSPEEIIARYEPGKAYECWLDPAKPEDAYLRKSSSILGWTFLVIPVSLMFFGFFGLARLFWESGTSEEHRAAKYLNKSPFSFLPSDPNAKKSLPTVPETRHINESPGTQLTFRLPCSMQPSLELFGAFLFCVLWNTVSWGVLIHSLYSEPFRHWSDVVFFILFALLFCGFGLFLFIWTLHRILTIFGLGPTIVEISDHPIIPGRRFRISMSQYGALRVRDFELSITCEEVARFLQGTDTLTSRKEVYRQRIFQRADFETSNDKPLQEECKVLIPFGAMHSMRSEHNEIRWKIEIHAKLIGWMDLHRECPIIVYPKTIVERSDSYEKRPVVEKN